MNILLDTTYILPFIGVNISDISTDRQILALLDSKDQIMVNRLSLFEALGKVRKSLLDEGSRTRVEKGFAAILGSDRLQVIPVVDEKTLPVVLDILTNGTKDIPDAVILASAIVYADMILTEARDIPVLIGEYDTEIECLNLNNFLKR